LDPVSPVTSFGRCSGTAIPASSFEAALIADEAKGRQIAGESDDGRLKWDKKFWESRQLNSNPIKEHLLANVSDDRVLTTGHAASSKGLAVAPLPGSAGQVEDVHR
jgi:hypothetical protein